jgi:hypothetical protein
MDMFPHYSPTIDDMRPRFQWHASLRVTSRRESIHAIWQRPRKNGRRLPEIGQAVRREMNSGALDAFPAEGKEIMRRTPSRCAAGVIDLIASRKGAKSPFLLLAQTTTLGRT